MPELLLIPVLYVVHGYSKTWLQRDKVIRSKSRKCEDLAVSKNIYLHPNSTMLVLKSTLAM